MTHYGSLGSHAVTDDVRDIRGTELRGTDDTNLGEVVDVIFDHDTMEIRYLVVDSGGWLEEGTFLFPADRVSVDKTGDATLTAAVNRQQIEDAPTYDDKAIQSEKGWKKYEELFKKYWDEKPVMHLKDDNRIITPPETPEPATSATQSRESGDRQVNAANLFPDRISDVFSDPAPSGNKVTLRPKSVARAEEAASGVTLLKPHWWEAFENYLRLHKDDIQANCSQCGAKAA